MKTAGIYIHIPFCATKCNYCDFYSITDSESLIPRFIKAICKEIEQCSTDTSKWKFDTIFIGGGTPSLIKAREIEKILLSIDNKFSLSDIKELTLEANPGEISINKLNGLKMLGINRLSIGVQSMQKKLLKFLTRPHSQKDVYKVFDSARSSGFENINCDLIYSIPGQTKKMWIDDLETIIKLGPDHISAYTLTVEKGTDLFKMVKNKMVIMPSENQIGNWFIDTHELLQFNGYSPYEISNFSKPGLQCMHNLHYWETDPYISFGPSAHSFDGSKRWNNVRSLNHYLESIESCKTPISKIEKLSGKDKINEYIGFGLRMNKGINQKKIPETYRLEFQNNLIQIRKKYTDCFLKNDASVSLSKKGMLYSDYIIPDLLL
tara:strand:- start:1599 stop:2729 length:1131 start_codon:yes stop_codon:yes gene_type:complete